MNRSMLITLGALIACLVVPTMAGASIAFTKIVAPYTFTSQPLNSTIYIYDHVKGSAPKTVALNVKGADPQISPDGKIVAYSKVSTVKIKTSMGSGTFDKYLLHFVTIATNVDIATTNECQNLVWAPDSSAVACDLTSMTGKGPTGLITVTPDGTPTTIVKNTDTVSVGWDSLTWSPDSSMIAWESIVLSSKGTNGFNPPKLRAKKADGSGSLIKLSNNASMPAWGPTQIAYQAFMGSGDSMKAQIWTVDPTTHNSSTATQLTHWTQPKNSFESGPAAMFWTPDGKTIVGAIMGEDDDANTVSINAASGKITTIGTNGSNAPIAVASDGSSILMYSYSQASNVSKAIGIVRTVSLSTGKSTLFMNNVSFMSASADWKP
jgi:Tol biopolymer transport system component